MPFENRSPGNAVVVRTRRRSFEEQMSRRPLDDDPTNRKSPPRPPTDVDSSWDRLATAISSVIAHVVMGFAIAAAGMFPALLWMLIEDENRRDAAEEPPKRGGSGGAFDPRHRRLVSSVRSGGSQKTNYVPDGRVSQVPGALGGIVRRLLFTAASLFVVTRITRAADPEITAATYVEDVTAAVSQLPADYRAGTRTGESTSWAHDV
jgi:hypothetical protein